jgi:ADP-ribose pyrophosphatase YjhB (NUDIX family)
VGVAVVSNGHLLLIQRGRGPQAGKWAVPGGKVDLGETIRETAVREVREETGLEVTLGPAIWVGESIGPGDPPEWHFTLIDFVAKPAGETRVAAADDAAAVRWVTLDEARTMDLTPTMLPLLEVLEEYM